MSKQKTHEEFVQEMALINSDIVIKGIYKKSNENVECCCKICNHIWYPKPNTLLSIKSGCPVCSGQKVLVGYNDLNTTHPHYVALLKNNEDGKLYTYGSHKKVDWICPNCKTIIENKEIKYIITCGLTCPKCSDGISLPNKIMFNLLNELNIIFNREIKFEWCFYYYKNKRYTGTYDFSFSIDNDNYIVEMDGGFHTNNNILSGQTKEESQYIDAEKDKLANENNHKVIRIECNKSNFNYIQDNIIKSYLAILFDLSNINWTQIFKNTMFSQKIQVINCWNQYHNFSKIYSVYKISETTCCRWLREGVVLELCDYNPQKHKYDIWLFNKINSGIRIKCLETGEEFDSISEAKRKYNIKGHTTLSKSKIMGHLVDGTYLHWKYIDDKSFEGGDKNKWVV
jgi:very-short-patch-repair endonuclease